MKAKPHSCVFYCVFEAVAQWLVSHFCCIVGNWVMGESSDSVSIDIEMIPLGGKVRNLGWYQHTQQKTIHFFFFWVFFFFWMQFMCVYSCVSLWVVLFMGLFFGWWNLAGMCGEDKQRFNICFCLWGSGKACFDNIPRCCSQLYASFLVYVLQIGAYLPVFWDSFGGFLWFNPYMLTMNVYFFFFVIFPFKFQKNAHLCVVEDGFNGFCASIPLCWKWMFFCISGCFVFKNLW